MRGFKWQCRVFTGTTYAPTLVRPRGGVSSLHWVWLFSLLLPVKNLILLLFSLLGLRPPLAGTTSGWQRPLPPALGTFYGGIRMYCSRCVLHVVLCAILWMEGHTRVVAGSWKLETGNRSRYRVIVWVFFIHARCTYTGTWCKLFSSLTTRQHLGIWSAYRVIGIIIVTTKLTDMVQELLVVPRGTNGRVFLGEETTRKARHLQKYVSMYITHSKYCD